MKPEKTRVLVLIEELSAFLYIPACDSFQDAISTFQVWSISSSAKQSLGQRLFALKTR